MSERTGHWVRPSIDAGMGVSLKITCHESEGAECRKVVDDYVDPELLSSPGGWDAFARPVVYKDGGYCQWVDFYASTGDYEAEFYDGEDDHTVAESEIVIWYESARDYDDGGAFYWRFAS